MSDLGSFILACVLMVVIYGGPFLSGFLMRRWRRKHPRPWDDYVYDNERGYWMDRLV